MPPAPVAIITAASKGIGAACARLLAQQGYHLALFARGSELGNLATELEALAVSGDLADSGAIEQLVYQTQQRYGRVDAVVNNTGHAVLRSLDFDLFRARVKLSESRSIMRDTKGDTKTHHCLAPQLTTLQTNLRFQVGDEITDFRVAFLSSVLGDSGQLPSAH